MLKALFNKKSWVLSAPSLINIAILSFLIWGESAVVDLLVRIFVSSIGGIFAAVLIYRLESQGKIANKRLEKYHNHRNTLVQIEHELLPNRVSLGNNITALKEAVEFSANGGHRLILRMYKTDFSTGLSLKLLNIDLINDYSQLFVLLRKINSDIDYLNQIVSNIKEKISIQRDTDSRTEKLNSKREINNLLHSYDKLIKYLLPQCQKADKKMLGLITKSQIGLRLDENEKRIRNKYKDDALKIEYVFTEDDLKKKEGELLRQEKKPYLDGETREQAFMLYYDLKPE